MGCKGDSPTTAKHTILRAKCGLWAQSVRSSSWGRISLSSSQMQLLTPEIPARTDAEGKSASHTPKCNWRNSNASTRPINLSRKTKGGGYLPRLTCPSDRSRYGSKTDASRRRKLSTSWKPSASFSPLCFLYGQHAWDIHLSCRHTLSHCWTPDWIFWFFFLFEIVPSDFPELLEQNSCVNVEHFLSLVQSKDSKM